MNKQLTFAMIKPDAVAANNTGKIIDLIEKNGFNIMMMDKVTFNTELAEEFYAVHKNKPFFKELVNFITSGPVIVMALEKENAIADWRTLMGATNPADAKEGTIRKLFAKSIGENAVHGSDSEENAAQELDQVFGLSDLAEDFDLEECELDCDCDECDEDCDCEEDCDECD
ncbi:MAG: Nucleoside diphosphate kinase [candidate division TM6 bacterium GW2011_GWF2_32_72]|nr:MAG: Nucleoside diphosphate kinase [candidate division TM6 bacterium GW2011_GWF2_32_72]